MKDRVTCGLCSVAYPRPRASRSGIADGGEMNCLEEIVRSMLYFQFVDMNGAGGPPGKETLKSVGEKCPVE